MLPEVNNLILLTRVSISKCLVRCKKYIIYCSDSIDFCFVNLSNKLIKLKRVNLGFFFIVLKFN